MDRTETQHPVLVTRHVHADGTYTLAFRVHCAARREAVPLDTCRECTRCSDIGGDSMGSLSWVRCAPVAGPERSSPLTVGDALQEGTMAVDENVSIRDVVALFVERGLRFLVVTDPTGRVSGMVRESQLLPHLREQPASESTGIALGWQRVWQDPVRDLMSSVRSVHESSSLRHALGLMATRRDRQLVVVDASGAPVGTVSDVEAIHVLHAKAHSGVSG